jgi:hypothetical protein
MLKIVTTTMFSILLSSSIVAQNVGIGTNTPNPSAKLEIESTDKGILIPRINIPNLAASAPVTAPAISLLAYNTNTTTGLGYYYWDGTQWVKLLNQSDTDHDWYEVGTTTPPNNINDDIYTQGNVGIGTISPTSLLHLDGGSMGNIINYDLVIERFGNSLPGRGVGIELRTGTAGTATQTSARISTTRTDGGSGTSLLFGTTDDSGVTNNNMSIIDNGNVGIGITAPEEKLVVNGITRLRGVVSSDNADQRIALEIGTNPIINNSSGPWTDRHFRILTETNLVSSAADFLVFEALDNNNVDHDGGFLFRGKATAGGERDIMSIRGNGRIGIGINNPTKALHIRGQDGGTNDGFGFTLENTGLRGKRYTIISSNDGYTHGSGKLLISGGNTTSPKIVLDSTGNVGIGITDPTQKLDIDGQTRIRQINNGTAATDTILVADIDGVIKKKDANALGLVTQTETEWRDAGSYIIARDAEANGNSVVVTDIGRLGVGTPSPLFNIQATVNGTGNIGLVDATAPISRISMGEGTSAAGQFFPLFFGRPVGTNNFTGLYSQIDPANDVVSSLPAMIFAARVEGGPPTNITNRNLFHWRNNFTDLMAMDSDGNLGIGTTTPRVKLEVSNSFVPAPQFGGTSALFDDRIEINGTGDHGIGFYTSADGGKGWNMNIEGNSGEDGELKFDAVGNTNNVLVLERNGNVGIGNNIPTQKIDIFGNSLVRDISYWGSNPAIPVIELNRGNGNLTNGADIYFDLQGSVVAEDNLFAVIDADNNSTTAAFTVSANNENPNAGTALMSVVETGNVGIGTTAPTNRLHVIPTPGFNPATNKLSSIFTEGSFGGGITMKDSGDPNAFSGLFMSTTVPTTNKLHLAVQDASGNLNRNHFVLNQFGNVGIGTTAPTERLHVIGNILASGTITSSDRRYKTNIHTLENALANVIRLRGVTYDMKKEHKEKGLGEGLQVGVIAQEVEKVYPELVITNPETGYKAVDYSKFTPILIQAIKEQQRVIDTHQTEQTAMKELLEQQQTSNRQLTQMIEQLQLQVQALEQAQSASASTK